MLSYDPLEQHIDPIPSFCFFAAEFLKGRDIVFDLSFFGRAGQSSVITSLLVPVTELPPLWLHTVP